MNKQHEGTKYIIGNNCNAFPLIKHTCHSKSNTYNKNSNDEH